MPMSRRLIAVVLAAVLIASLSAALLGAIPVGRGASAPSDATPGAAANVQPSTDIYPTLYNGVGNPSDSHYYPGVPGYGTLEFYIYDTVDHTVNVTVVDPNATRDHVASPAFSYTATINATTYSFYSGAFGVSYAFPDLGYGGTWLVNFSAPSGNVSEKVVLYTYSVSAESSAYYPQSILPGDAFTLTWAAYLDTNGATLYTGATNVSIVGHYRTDGTTKNFFPSGIMALPVGSWGTWSGTVPLNATADQDIEFTIWMTTVVGGQVAENESDTVDVSVGHVVIQQDGLFLIASECLGYHEADIPAGSLVASCVRAGSEYGGEFTAISGLTVTVAYWNGTHHITAPGNPPVSGVTNANGTFEVLFNATAPFVNELQYPYYDAVNFTVTVPGANSTVSVWTLWDNLTWAIDPYPFASGVVSVALDHTEYYVDTNATVTWSISSSSEGVTGPITADSWQAWSYSSDTLYASGVFTGTAQSGTFTFPITAGMVNHEFYVILWASNATASFSGYASANVIIPTLLLTPGSGYYTSGSTTHITASFSGSAGAPAGTVVGWQAFGLWSNTQGEIASGTSALGATFSIAVPSATPPEEIGVDAWAESAGSVLATNNTVMYLETGYSVLLGVGTVSSYSDGSFQPGQTVTLNYQVASIDGTALPQQFNFELTAPGYAFYQPISTTSSSGSVSFTIPSNAPAGYLTVDLTLQSPSLTAGYCLPTGTCMGSTAMLINPHPSVLSLELGAGSGLTVGWLILLVLLIVVALVLYLALRHRGGSSGASSSGTVVNPATPMSPPAPAPSTPPATQWQEPTPASPSSSSPPPLPPPGGSS